MDYRGALGVVCGVREAATADGAQEVSVILDEGLGKVELWLRKGDSGPEQLLMAVAHLLDKRRAKG